MRNYGLLPCDALLSGIASGFKLEVGVLLCDRNLHKGVIPSWLAVASYLFATASEMVIANTLIKNVVCLRHNGCIRGLCGWHVVSGIFCYYCGGARREGSWGRGGNLRDNCLGSYLC